MGHFRIYLIYSQSTPPQSILFVAYLRLTILLLSYVPYSRKIGGELNLADWQIWGTTAKLNSAKIFELNHADGKCGSGLS